MEETGIIYARISPSKNAKGGPSTENQEAACRKEAEHRDVVILKVFVDTAKSGTTRKGRPAFQEALKFVVENNVKYLFVTETDRFARNSADHKLVKEFLKKHGCKLVSISQSFTESEEPSDELTDGIVSLMNEHYSKSYSIKTRRGMQTKVENGGWPHKAKPGYLNVAIADGAKVRRVVKPDEAKRHLYEESFKLYSTGNYNHTVLNNLMYEKGLQTESGKKMAPSKFIKMLADPFYTGKIIYKGKEYEGKHEAIIDQTTFELCQAVRKQHNQFANRERKHSERFFLRHVLRCGICGGRITAELHEKKGLAYYHCSLTKKKHSNAGQNVRSDELEKLIANEFRKIQFTKPLMEKIVARAKEILDETHNGVDKQRRGLQNRIMKLESRRKNVETDRADRVIDAETYQRMSEEIRVELAQSQKQLNELAEKREDNIDVFSRLMELTDDLHETYRKAQPHLKRHLLTLFFKTISTRDKLIHNIEYTEIIAALLENRVVIINDDWLGLLTRIRAYSLPTWAQA
jgi:DNA invertase Pin-like site-specific DNA recombinase/PHD/YefM family antitoxin component YafN of YafNO toxin-antitoxin module